MRIPQSGRRGERGLEHDILFYTVSGPEGPASRYRVFQYLPFLEREGFRVGTLPLYGPARHRLESVESTPIRRALVRGYQVASLPGRAAQLLRAGSARLIHIERELFPLPTSWPERAAGRVAPYVLEFDDAVFLRPGLGGKYPRLLRGAAAVIAGNGWLAEYAGRHNRRVHVVPTVVPVSRCAARTEYGIRPGSPARVGWVGLASNLASLAPLAEPLARLARERPLELRVISARPARLPGVPTRFAPWREAEDARLGEVLDVGLMPLADTAWNRGKCGLKILQYMAAGLPVVASPVGVNREIVRDGENGFLARSQEEWYEMLRILLSDEGLRARMGRKGRETVEREYSLETWGPRVAGLYASLLEAAG